MLKLIPCNFFKLIFIIYLKKNLIFNERALFNYILEMIFINSINVVYHVILLFVYQIH